MRWLPLPMLALLFVATPALAQPEPPSAAPPPALAPDPTAHRHDGFYFRVGLGAGYVATHGEAGSMVTNDHGVGAALWLAIGGTPVPGLVVGGLLHAVDGSDQSSHYESIGNVGLGPFVDWYPDPTDGWHLGGFVGLGGASVRPQGSDRLLSSSALGGAAFGGYDWWIGPQWSLGVMGVLAGATPAKLEDGGTPTDTTIAPVSFAVDAVLLLH